MIRLAALQYSRCKVAIFRCDWSILEEQQILGLLHHAKPNLFVLAPFGQNVAVGFPCSS